MRAPILLSILFLSAAALSSCGAYRDDRTSYRWRSEHFQKILSDKQAVEAFRRGDSNAVGAFITSRLATDPAFAKAYRETLEEEGVKLFSPVQVAHYFHSAIHVRIR